MAFHVTTEPSFFSVIFLMVLSFLIGFASIHIFEHILVTNPHFMSDLFGCNHLTIHDLYRYNIYVIIPTVYIPSLFYTFLDKYFEHHHTLHLKRIYNPGCKPLRKIPWHSVQRATIVAFFHRLSISFLPYIYWCFTMEMERHL
eukprot:640549_1